MAVVPLTVFQMPKNYPALPPTALSLDIGLGQSATTAADGVSFPCTGKETILIKGGAAAQVVTVTSVVNGRNRLGDIVYTVGIGLMSVLPKIQPLGFNQANGTVVITINAGGTDVKFWCIRDAS
jgi:hypothetical protein